MKRKHLKSGPKVETECERKIVVKAGKKTENNVGRKRVRKRERERTNERRKRVKKQTKAVLYTHPFVLQMCPQICPHLSHSFSLSHSLSSPSHTLSLSSYTNAHAKAAHVFNSEKRRSREKERALAIQKSV